MSQIATQKRLLTTFTKKLEQVVSKLEGEKLEEASREPIMSQGDLKDLTRRLEEGNTSLTTASLRVEKQLGEYASTVDALKGPNDKEMEDFEEYASKAESATSRAFDLSILLQARLASLTTGARSTHSITDSGGLQPGIDQIRNKQVDLPLLPVPTFEGNLWEWENFWEIFDNSVLSQNLPELVKYNYLLNALRGPAKEATKKFQVTKGNYNKATQFLLNKYNNKELLVNQLVERLDKCVLRSPSIRDQRSLLEEVQVIVTQLIGKRENVDSSWMIRKVLSKVPVKIMRAVIAKRLGTASETSFTMNDLIQSVDRILSTEERCAAYIGNTPNTRQPSRIGQRRIIL